MLCLQFINTMLEPASYEDLIERISSLPYSLPTRNNKIQGLVAHEVVSKDKIENLANSVRAVLHERLIFLAQHFIFLKTAHGSKVEKTVYTDMPVHQLITRLLTKRPLVFYLPTDRYVLRDGRTRDHGGFEKIGTHLDHDPLSLRNYMSYDEMELSALVALSCPTPFINVGDRTNVGVLGEEGTFQREGVYVGLVGTRFERPGWMEWRHMVITPTQNTQDNGYGPNADPLDPKTQYVRMWASFYREKHLPTYDEAASVGEPRFVRVKVRHNAPYYLDTHIYQERIRIAAQTLLAEANDRARRVAKQAYVHVVGFGLGVWAIHDSQRYLFASAFREVIARLPLSNVAAVDLVYVLPPEATPPDEVIGDVTLLYSKRNPADPLTGPYADYLLVATFAADSNSYPGNEYWEGQLSASGDPAAACCSCIPELLNPEVNYRLRGPSSVVVTTGVAPDSDPVVVSLPDFITETDPRLKITGDVN